MCHGVIKVRNIMTKRKTEIGIVIKSLKVMFCVIYDQHIKPRILTINHHMTQVA